jgi:hypothetical protein
MPSSISISMAAVPGWEGYLAAGRTAGSGDCVMLAQDYCAAGRNFFRTGPGVS